ncbi:hypothetical protein Vretimale_18811 [Volvox reticuliferus]|uniref:Uncharacterized protein n=1 Tax=Volvox reticuliferus TaxID=1737510 RepID=A0A8J4GXW1_9CHLO|nr:hypothetical protein Vretimale_18811 [Volvox reticuliferus]
MQLTLLCVAWQLSALAWRAVVVVVSVAGVLVGFARAVAAVGALVESAALLKARPAVDSFCHLCSPCRRHASTAQSPVRTLLSMNFSRGSAAGCQWPAAAASWQTSGPTSRARVTTVGCRHCARLLVRSSACHYAWLPKLVAGFRLCHFLVPEPEQLRVLGNDEAATMLAAVAAIPGATDHGAAAAEMAGKGLDDVRQKDGTGMDETEQPQQQGNTEDERDWQEVGEYNTDDQGVPHGASSAGVAGQSGCNALAAAEQRVAMAAAGFFVEAGLALLDIAEGRLYRLAGYLSFADYVESSSSVLGFGLRQARNLIAAARFVRNFPPDVAPPSCERQVRPLVGFHTDLQIRAWALALERAGGVGSMRVSGRLVEECLREVKGLLADAAMGPDVIATKHQRASPVHYGGLHVFTRSETCEWYTPDFILDLVRELFAPGHIDLDPCSCAAANTRVRAISYYDERVDGLAEMNEWNGNVFLNPAFGMRDGHSLHSGAVFCKMYT